MNPSTSRDHFNLAHSRVEDEDRKLKALNQSERSFFLPQQNQEHVAQKNISKPIKFQFERSDAEMDLLESEMLAEQRDYTMFVRLVNGMSAKASKSFDTKTSLANVIRTRNAFPNLSESDIGYNCNSQDFEGLLTPELSNVPNALCFASTTYPMSTDYNAGGHLSYFGHRNAVPASVSPTPMSEACPPDDDIFDLDL